VGSSSSSSCNCCKGSIRQQTLDATSRQLVLLVHDTSYADHVGYPHRFPSP
jgi:hypothetical protein